MILEHAMLHIKAGQSAQFEAAFHEAQNILMKMPGYLSHELQKSLDSDEQYLLLVRWRRLEDHTQGFRLSADYQRWKALLHHFYEPFPTVLYFHSPWSGAG